MSAPAGRAGSVLVDGREWVNGRMKREDEERMKRKRKTRRIKRSGRGEGEQDVYCNGSEAGRSNGRPMMGKHGTSSFQGP